MSNTEVSKLKEIAALNVATALWNHVNVPRTLVEKLTLPYYRYSTLLEKLSEQVDSFIFELSSIPKPIRTYIDGYTCTVRVEIDAWMRYHSREIFFNKNDQDLLLRHIEQLVWYSNGTINCKETARNLLNSLWLSPVEKFYLLCTYCLKDEIEHMSPSLFTSDVIGAFDFSHRPLIYYWWCYFEDKLDKIPIREGVPIDVLMFKHPGVNNWPAKEYFFDRLSSEEQITCAGWMIKQHDIKNQILVLFKLTEAQRARVYMDVPVPIMYNCFNAARGEDYVAVEEKWFEIRDLITQHQFVSIFKKLLPLARSEQILKFIWINSCDDFKVNLVNFNDGEVVKEIFNLRFNKFSASNELLFALIRELVSFSRDDITLEDFFISFCENLVHRDDYSMLDRFFNSCFADPRKLVPCKRQLIGRDSFCNRCVELISGGFTEKLEKLLNLCLPEVDECAHATFKRDLISKPYFKAKCLVLIKSNELLKADLLINSCLPLAHERVAFKELLTKNELLVEYLEALMMREDDEDEGIKKFNGIVQWCLILDCKVAKYIQDFVTNAKQLKEKFLSFSSIEHFEQLSKHLSKIFPSERLVLQYKKNILMSEECLEKCLLLFPDKIDLLDEIISDCLPDTDSLAEFKKLIIFSPSIIQELHRNYVEFARIDSLKKYVNWSMVSGQDKKLLKNAIIGVDKINWTEFACAYFTRNWGSSWKDLMLWWLENPQNVREFKKTLPVDKIFDELLKASIFSKYDTTGRGLVSNCRFRTNYGFSALDQFLNWYFETGKAVKQYKLQRIDLHGQIDTIRTLLRKKNLVILEAMIEWFFQKDSHEIAKFKLKNMGRRILQAFK